MIACKLFQSTKLIMHIFYNKYKSFLKALLQKRALIETYKI